MMRDKNIRGIVLFLDEPRVIMDLVDEEWDDEEGITTEVLTRAINKIGVPEYNRDEISLEGQTEVVRYVDVMTIFRLAKTSSIKISPKTYTHINQVINSGNIILDLTMKEFMTVMNWFSVAKQEGYSDESSPVYQKLFG